MTAFAALALLFAALPTVLYFRNVRLFNRAPESGQGSVAISVLIPARNEERSIRDCVTSVLANQNVDLECIVLDDDSQDRTASIVRELCAVDARLRLATAPPLPAGWSGKQHACFQLSRLATKPLLCFLDADVRLAPTALARVAAFQKSAQAPLVSGFPRQETGSLLEILLIPLIHFLLLCYLPLARMRKSLQAGLGAGCGQLFLTSRSAYDAVGGHGAVKTSFHDGVKLPRAFRRHGFMTDIFDATDIATCRMYRSASQVWNGLAKNAREGLGSPIGIWFWTAILLLGHVVPFGLAVAVVTGLQVTMLHLLLILLACLLSWSVRLDAATRFHQSWLSALLHPIGIVLLLVIQWYAAIRAWLRRPVGWKGRANPIHPVLPTPPDPPSA